MILKVYSLLLLIGSLALAAILSYYLNIGFDHKAVIAFLGSKLSSSFRSDNSIKQSGLNANRS